jgi:hypothetical protein
MHKHAVRSLVQLQFQDHKFIVAKQMIAIQKQILKPINQLLQYRQLSKPTPAVSF